MSTKIEWCEETWSPIIGCSHISPGCQNCYAEKMAGRLSNMQSQVENYGHVVKWVDSPKTSDYPIGKWNGKTHFVESALEKPFSWKKPRRIFVCSMSDLFHEMTPFEWVDKVINVIRWTKQHTYLFLTKRPERMYEYFNSHVPEKYYMGNGNILDNLWLGVTAENQEQADKRIPILLDIPAAKRFVSIEPMLGPVDISDYLHDSNCNDVRKSDGVCICSDPREHHLDWVICGGESGPNARPMCLDWVKSIINQCEKAHVPVMVKQLYRNGKKITLPEINGKIYNQLP